MTERTMFGAFMTYCFSSDKVEDLVAEATKKIKEDCLAFSYEINQVYEITFDQNEGIYKQNIVTKWASTSPDSSDHVYSVVGRTVSEAQGLMRMYSENMRNTRKLHVRDLTNVYEVNGLFIQTASFKQGVLALS